MRAMILAAGRGERMGELTLTTPKPLLRVGNHFLIEYAIHNCKRAGIYDVVINVSYGAEKIKNALGDGKQYGINIQYSEEVERLEVGGGIFNALSHLGQDPFIVISADVITDYPLKQLKLKPIHLAHLILVDNQHYHPEGDFGLRDGLIDFNSQTKLTFANVGIYHPKIFANCQPGYFSWRTVMQPVIDNQQVTGEYFSGNWHNVGTPQDLSRANEDANLRTLVEM